ncbi:MAG: protease modulator HflC [Phycisphaerae bacterium]|nr:protease modulator HflC [Phycisphaerae bacterium]
MKKHLGIILIGVIIVSVLIMYMITFQVRQQEKALVMTFGKITDQVDEPGLQWIMPWQKVVKFDTRIRTLIKEEVQTITQDEKSVVVQIYVNWRINDPQAFYKSFRQPGQNDAQDVIDAAKRIMSRTWIAEATNTITEYNFSDLVTDDSDKFKLGILEKGTAEQPGGMLGRIRNKVEADGADYGIEFVDLGISRLQVPSSVTESVFNRMMADRGREVRISMAEGASEASKIEGEAKSNATINLAKAQATAKATMGAGDAEAAKYYSTFLEHPELAGFLRQLETLRETLSGRTTIVLDVNTPAYKLLFTGPTANGATKENK